MFYQCITLSTQDSCSMTFRGVNYQSLLCTGDIRLPRISAYYQIFLSISKYFYVFSNVCIRISNYLHFKSRLSREHNLSRKLLVSIYYCDFWFLKEFLKTWDVMLSISIFFFFNLLKVRRVLMKIRMY